MKSLRILTCVLFIASAFAGWAVGPQTKDVPSTGIAGGISSCTTTNGCLACGNDVTTGAKVCVNLRSNGSCSCSVKSYDGGVICSATGTCTYRP